MNYDSYKPVVYRDDPRGTWGIGDARYGPLRGSGWFLSGPWT